MSVLNPRMPTVKVIGKPCDRKGHARIDEERLETESRYG
jgi:hypothetical protein